MTQLSEDKLKQQIANLCEEYDVVFEGVPGSAQFFFDDVLSLFREHEAKIRADELNRCTTNRIGDEWPEIRVNVQLPDGGWIDVSKAERVAQLTAPTSEGESKS